MFRTTVLAIVVAVTLSIGYLVSQYSSSLESTQNPLKTVKMPSYLGKGYDLLKGNPFTDHIDAGFRAPIFTFTYNKNLSTDDGRYNIPDYTSSVESISCSLDTKCKTYSGTERYQKQLSNISRFDVRLNTSFIDASFTLSDTYRELETRTTTQKQTTVQSNAQCYIYTVQMPLFSNEISLTDDFIKGVKAASQKNDWEEFVEHFGTHYATEVIFGGRYILEHTYSQESMSYFKSMGLDVSRAARVQFLNTLDLNKTQEATSYQNQTNVINTRVDFIRNSIIGGQPTKSGDWVDWSTTVKNSLAPVAYKLTTLSVLFNFIHFFDSAKAIKQFESYLNSYCGKHACPPIVPDRPEPKPLNVTFHQTDVLKGKSVNKRTYDTMDEGVKVGMRVNRVLMGSQGSIDSIQFFLSDGLLEHDLDVIGDRPFNHDYRTPPNDQIRCIRFGITYNGDYWKFSSMQFVTRNDDTSKQFAGTDRIHEYKVICIEAKDEHFVGFHGNYGSTFDSIGFNIMKEAFQN